MSDYQSPGERIEVSFAAWEVRARGWQLADYQVELEPPYRPFILLPGTVADGVIIDDGKRPTPISSLISFVRSPIRALTTTTSPSPPPLVEPYPREAVGPDGGLAFLSVTVPADFKSRPEQMAQMILALGMGESPVHFEWIGCAGKVRLQLAVAADDADHVTRLIASFSPEAAISRQDDALESRWWSAETRMVVDFGLEDEFFLPLATDFARDNLLALIPGLAAADRNEVVAVQVSFQRVRNAWAQEVRDVVGESESDCLFAEAPHFASLAKKKTATPLFAVTVRLGIGANDRSSLRALGRDVMPFFQSFSMPGSNELMPLDNEDYPDDLHAVSFVERATYRTGMILSLDELVTLAHLPDAAIQSEALIRESKRTRSLHTASGRDFVIGNNRIGGTIAPVTMGLTDRLAHMHVIGASGVGKSTLLHAMAMQDIESGRGIAVIDPAGDLVDDIARAVPKSRAGDVVYFDPADIDHPIGLGLLEASTELEKMALVDDITGIFQRLATSWGDTMTTTLANAVMAAVEHPDGGTLLDIRRLLIDDEFRKRYIAKIDDPEIRFFWQKQYATIGSRSAGPILSRLDSFLRPRAIRNIVGVRRSKHSPAKALAEGKILLAKLSHGVIGEQNSYLLGSLLIAKLQQAAMARQSIDRDARTPFFLYVDEVQGFVTPSLTSLLTGARKYALGAILAHQHVSQLINVPEFKQALLGNAQTRVVFRVGESDAKELAAGFAHFEPSDLLNLDRGEAIGRFGEAGKDFSLGTKLHTATGDFLSLDDLRALSRQSYASTVEVHTTPTVSVEDSADDSSTAIQPSAQQAIEQFIAPPPMPTVRDDGRLATFSEPPKDGGKGGREHRYVQQLVKRLGEDRGFKATIEFPVEDGRVDVVLERKEFSLAFEISITNSAAYEIGNVEKCLRANFSHVYFVCSDHKRRAKVEAAVTPNASGKAIAYIAPEEVVLVLDKFERPQTESVVRGYRVKVNRPTATKAELATRRDAIAAVIARSLVR